MPSKLIELEDGVLVEVEADTGQSREISGGFAEKVDSTLDRLRPVLLKACKPVLAMCRELKESDQIDSAEVELAFGFEAEGHVFIARAASSANIRVRLKIKG